MSFIIAALGNPGEEYQHTRHNAGRIVLEHFRKHHQFADWQKEKKWKALVSKGALGAENILLIEPDAFMNNSGKSIAPLITSAKKAERLVVVYDDIDLPLGTLKISYDRSSGGHKGLESIIRSIKTKAFVRLRVGVAPVTLGGKTKKPKGEQKVVDFLMGAFTPKERDILKSVSKKVTDALALIVSEGREKAMGEVNG